MALPLMSSVLLKVVVAAPVMVPPVQVAAPSIGVSTGQGAAGKQEDVVWLPPLRLTVNPAYLKGAGAAGGHRVQVMGTSLKSRVEPAA